METKYIYIIVIIAILTISAIAIILCYQSIQSKNKKLAKLADILSVLAVEEQMAELKLETTQLYNLAWFKSLREQSEAEVKEAEEQRIALTNAGCRLQVWRSDEKDPIMLEQEMQSKLKSVEGVSEKIAIIQEYVPRIIYTIADTQHIVHSKPDSGLRSDLTTEELQEYRRLESKYFAY